MPYTELIGVRVMTGGDCRPPKICAHMPGNMTTTDEIKMM